MALVRNGKLAVSECVPQLDSSVARPRNDLTVIGGEGNGKNIVGVAYKATSSDTGCELPEAEGFVPGRGEGVGTIGGNDLRRLVNFPYLPEPKDLRHTQSETM